MRNSTPVILGFFVLATVVLTQDEANAQGFFQTLFGFGQSSPPPPPPSLRSFGRSSPYGSGYYQPYNDDQSYGSYRTLCVRTCDGYYWPISANTTRDQFDRDADACEANCTSKARLFYLPHNSDDIENMTDLSGRRYGQLRSAFAYRKTLKAGCTCKPMPWAKSEKARHDHYALVEKLEQQRRMANASASKSEPSEGAPPTIATGAESGPTMDPGLPIEVSSSNRPMIFGPTENDAVSPEYAAAPSDAFAATRRIVIRRQSLRKRQSVRSVRAAGNYVAPIGGLRARP